MALFNFTKIGENLKTRLAIQEAIECFGSPMIASIIEGGLISRHRMEVRMAYKKAQEAGDIPKVEFTDYRGQEEVLRNISRLDICIEGADIYLSDLRRERAKSRKKLRRERAKSRKKLKAEKEEPLLGMSQEELLAQLRIELGFKQGEGK